jgi:hypothetical protein
MACDGTRVFVLGGALCPGAHWKVDKTELIWVLDTSMFPFCHSIWTAFKFETELLIYPEPDSNTVKHSEKTTRLAQKLSTGQPQHGIFSSSDAGETYGAFPFQTATSGEMGRTNGLLSQPTGVDYKPRCVLQGDNDSESSTGHHPKLVAPDASSEKEVARLEHERIADLERQLSETLVERDRHIAQLTDQLAQTSALLERAEANAAEAKENAGLELRELQAKLDESLLSGDHAREQAQSALLRASCAAEANEQSQRELEASKSELAAFRLRLADTENGCAESKAEADTYRNQTATALVNTDEDRVVHRLLEGMQCKLWKPE